MVYMFPINPINLLLLLLLLLLLSSDNVSGHSLIVIKLGILSELHSFCSFDTFEGVRNCSSVRMAEGYPTLFCIQNQGNRS